jgi:DNA-binding SARP family transcriptional activator
MTCRARSVGADTARRTVRKGDRMSTDRAGRHLQVIGTFGAGLGDRRLVLRPSARRVLALLAVRGELARPEASGLLWPDLTQTRALANLRTALWRARQDCPGFVHDGTDVVGLGDVAVDLSALRDWAWQALRDDGPPADAPPITGDDLLPGWGDEWLVQPREELRLMKVYALEASSKRLLHAGRFGEAAGLALAAVNMDPLRESANQILIEVHLRHGNRCDAIRQFRRYTELLRWEMQAEPGPGLTALMAPLQTARPRTAGTR